MKSVSVIVPAYNVERYIRRCLDSLMDQSLESLEVIVINDGSTDGTGAILEEYSRKYPERLVTKTVPNGGAGSARNEGLKLATGEFVGFVDSDDYVSGLMFEKLYRKACEEEADIVCCGYRRINGTDVQLRGIRKKEIAVYGNSVFEEPDLFLYSTPYLWNKLFRRSMLTKHEGVFEHFPIFEDLLFTYRMFLFAKKIACVAEPLYTYIFSRDGSLTADFSEKRFALMPAFDRLYETYEQAGCREQFADQLAFILIKHIYVVCEREAGISMWRRKFCFISESFRYLRRVYPQLASHTRYYREYGNKKGRYESKWYWYYRTVFPWPARARSRFGILKRSMRFSIKGGLWYFASLRKPLQPKRVLLQSQQGKNLHGNMFYLLKELAGNPAYREYELALGVAGKKQKDFMELLKCHGLDVGGRIRLLRVNSREFIRYLATAEVIFSDSSLPSYFLKREGQRYLNTWHGTPLKTLGNATEKDYYDMGNLQKTFRQADVLTYPSKFMREAMVRDYMLKAAPEGEIWLSGYPRNEIFFDRARAAAVRRELQIEKKEVLAYMPTWRGTLSGVNGKGKNTWVEKILRDLDEGLDDSRLLYVNLHHYDEQGIDFAQYRHIRKFPQQYEAYELLNACDCLITDYSSVFFDYGITEKPVILFVFDKEAYLRERGLYLELDSLPYPQVRTVAELLQQIRTGAAVEPERYQTYRETYEAYERPSMAADLCAQFLKGEDRGIETAPRPDADRSQVLVFADSLQYADSRRSLMELWQALERERAADYCLTYEKQYLTGNQEYLRMLPEGSCHMGVLNPFQVETLWESLLLARMESDSRIYPRHQKRIDTMLRREYEKNWPNLSLKGTLACGTMSIRELATAANGAGYKTVYFESTAAVKPALSKALLEKFDRIVAADREIKEALEQIPGVRGMQITVAEAFLDLDMLYRGAGEV